MYSELWLLLCWPGLPERYRWMVSDRHIPVKCSPTTVLGSRGYRSRGMAYLDEYVDGRGNEGEAMVVDSDLVYASC